MTKYTVLGSGKTLDLNISNPDMEGGEGYIFIKRDIVYKICKPGCMIPYGKFQELSKLEKDNIIKPQNIILDSANNHCGYTMKKVPGKPIPLAQMLTKTYRESEKVSEEDVKSLIVQMREGIEYIHSKGCLQVDGNELNYMVTNGYKDLYFIDVNSFQTKSYKAHALMDSIKDFHAKDWSENTDWFSFAVISFYMFTGIHPFKGRHKKFKTLEDRMKNNISVFDNSVIIPKNGTYFPFENHIPKSYMDWYRAVFIDGKRLPPPKDFTNIIVVQPQIKSIVGSNLFDIKSIRKFESKIIGRFGNLGKHVFVTENGTVYKNRTFKFDGHKIAFSPTKNVPYSIKQDGDFIEVQCLEDSTITKLQFAADKLMYYGGRVYVKSSRNIYEFNIVEMPNKTNFSFIPVANVSEFSTRMYNGVAIQNLFNNCFISIFPKSKNHNSVKIQELNDYKITEAKYEEGILMVVGNKKGKYDRLVFRFDKDFNYDVRTVQDISPTGLNFTVLDNGLCVSINESEAIEIFSRVKGSPDIKTLSDDVLGANMRLFSDGQQVLFARGSEIFSFSMK